MDEYKVLSILKGNFEKIPSKRSKSVRIFLSSTFSGKLKKKFTSSIFINKIKTIFLKKDTHTERG
jgi:hypothetical protein